MLIRIFSYLVFFTVFIAVYALFAIKDKVITLNYQLNEVLKQINSERDTIHVLKAELSYLSSPDRLRRLSSKYLELETIKISQMIKDPIMSDGEAQAMSIESSNINFVKHHTKWRYKKGPTKYLQTIANQR